MADSPLSAWLCDVCGEPITALNAGLLVWRTDKEMRCSDFRVVHKSMNGRHCGPGASDGRLSSVELNGVLGDSGRARLLSFLSVGPVKRESMNPRIVDYDEYVDVFHRFQTPWYEEARPYFQTEAVQLEYGDVSEVLPYLPSELKRIAGLGGRDAK